ncbi:MAG: hypothetical protein AAGA32_13835 [Pseudomonadota bacterium]
MAANINRCAHSVIPAICIAATVIFWLGVLRLEQSVVQTPPSTVFDRLRADVGTVQPGLAHAASDAFGLAAIPKSIRRRSIRRMRVGAAVSVLQRAQEEDRLIRPIERQRLELTLCRMIEHAVSSLPDAVGAFRLRRATY